jgi:hypothetical protein
MERKGINWLWPDKTDILIYEKSEILKKITAPISRNKRGLFVIEEISEFQN